MMRFYLVFKFILKSMNRTAEKFWRHCVLNMYVTGNLSDRDPADVCSCFLYLLSEVAAGS